jgi:hypothetical protein
MMRLSPHYRLRVPNGLAIAGAFLLLASTLAGVNDAPMSQVEQEIASVESVLTDNPAETTAATAEAIEAVPQPAVIKHKRFKVNLFLFRR